MAWKDRAGRRREAPALAVRQRGRRHDLQRVAPVNGSDRFIERARTPSPASSMREKHSFEPRLAAVQHAEASLKHRTQSSSAALRTLEMTTRFAIRPLRLNTGELLDVSNGEGITVACLEGSLWITQSDDTRDIVLEAGQAFVLDRPGLALVCAAAGPATLAIERSPPPPPPLTSYFWDMRNAARNLSASRGVNQREGARRERVG